MAQKNYLPSTDQNIQFTSIENGQQQRHELVGWKLNDNDEASPILFPTPSKKAKITYSMGFTLAAVELKQ
jgi:hypothetical protein